MPLKICLACFSSLRVTESLFSALLNNFTSKTKSYVGRGSMGGTGRVKWLRERTHTNHHHHHHHHHQQNECGSNVHHFSVAVVKRLFECVHTVTARGGQRTVATSSSLSTSVRPSCTVRPVSADKMESIYFCCCFNVKTRKKSPSSNSCL